MSKKFLEDRAHEKFFWGAVIFLLSSVVLVTALGFEHLGGYVPCPLCLQQRYAYYGAISFLLIAIIFERKFPVVSTLIFFLVALGYLANTLLGAYHAGVEWHFWAGPDTCGTQQALPVHAEDLLSDLSIARVVRCDEAAWRFLGLSFAGWNTLISLMLFSMSSWTFWRALNWKN